MIRIVSLQIEEFRGIRKMSLVLDRKSFAVCGPNGTGKSGIVDAIDFVLTGQISRLAGKGSGAVSTAEHGPHVDSRNSPEKARVIATLEVQGVKELVTLERSIKSPSKPKITPSTPAIKAALDEVQRHPEIVLSRREIIKYILCQPSERSQHVQALLRLDNVGKIRATLEKISNACRKDVSPRVQEREIAKGSLATALGVPEVNKESLLLAVNERRRLLGLKEFSEITATTSVKDGVATADPAGASKLSKAQVTADLAALKDVEGKLVGSEFQKALAIALSKVEALSADASTFALLSREAFLRMGVPLVADDNACPFCDLPYERTELLAHLTHKLEQCKSVSLLRSECETALLPVTKWLREVKASLLQLTAAGKALQPPVDIVAVEALVAQLDVRVAALVALLPLAATKSVLESIGETIDQPTRDAREAITKAVAALPEASQEAAAREFLVLAQERLEKYRELALRHQKAERQAARAELVCIAFDDASTDHLTKLYDTVQSQFSTFYQEINEDDEGEFQGYLKQTSGSLEFDVDFYGRGKFPPGAYHSEGHQDSMGLCLYLALMRHLLGGRFTLAVLDDVLMSVDAGHRKAVCTLLKKHFDKTQFVFTTHDPVWLNHMASEGLIGSKGSRQFRRWTVDDGPQEWNDNDVWTEIDEQLRKSGVNTAAGVLRRYLEFVGSDLADRLRAPTPHRADGRYELGDLLPASISTFCKALKRGKAAAQSWNQADAMAKVEAREQRLDAARMKIRLDQWQMNAAIHFNSWENLQPNEFEPLVAGYREALSAMRCDTCGQMLRLTTERPDPEALKCDCGAATINLKSRPKE